jgi:UDP-glucuronate 4-epimerase
MRVIVTGAAGFIGSHCCLALLDRGDDVVGIDSINDYYPTIIKHKRLESLRARAGFSFEQIDLAEPDRFAAVVSAAQPDVVCHLAAQAGVRYSLVAPRAYIQANLVAFNEVLEACRGAGVARLVYASSSSVYGGNTELPFSVRERVDTPISLYAATKRSNELVAHTWSHLFGMQTIGLRFFTVYGPLGRPDMALWKFAEMMRRGLPLPIYNSGKMQRDVTYIDDIVAGTIAAIDRVAPGAAEVYNLGNDKPEKLLDLVQTLADALGIEPELKMLPMQPGDVPATWADITESRANLGFNPRTGIAEGIPRFAEWFMQNPELEEAAAEWRRSNPDR